MEQTTAVSSEADTQSIETREETTTEHSENFSVVLNESTTLLTSAESKASTLQTTSANDIPEQKAGYTIQVTLSPRGVYGSGASTNQGFTMTDAVNATPSITEVLTVQPESPPMISTDKSFTVQDISDVVTTSTQSSSTMVAATTDVEVTFKSMAPTGVVGTEKATSSITSSMTSQEITMLHETEAAPTEPSQSSSTSKFLNPSAGGVPNSGIDPMETGRRGPEVTHTTEPPEAYPSVNGVRLRLGLNADYGACVRGREWQFREHIRRQLSVLLRVPLPGVRNVRVMPGSIIVEAVMVPVKTSLLEVDKSALLAARTDLQDRIDRGTVEVTDLDGNRLPIFTSTIYSLQPPRGTSYSPVMLGALTAMFFGATSVVVASAYLIRGHLREGHVSPSPEGQPDVELPAVDERPFLRLVSPSLLISTRLDDPATASILRDARMLPRRSLVPDPPVYKPARNESDATAVTSLPPPI
ncbi:hypothetical protein MRX96_018095 [Rhipicephalus microplus]